MPSVKTSFSRRERWLLSLVCIALIAVSIGTTLVVAELVVGQRAQRSVSMVRPISLHEAQLSCEVHARNQLGKRVRILEVDDHSSRLEEAAGVYKVFFHGELFTESRLGRVLTDEPTDRHYLNCYVHMNSAEVELFEVLGDEEGKPNVIGGSKTNAFGIEIPK